MYKVDDFKLGPCYCAVAYSFRSLTNASMHSLTYEMRLINNETNAVLKFQRRKLFY